MRRASETVPAVFAISRRQFFNNIHEIVFVELAGKIW